MQYILHASTVKKRYNSLLTHFTFDFVIKASYSIMANEQNLMMQPEDRMINVNDGWQVLLWCNSFGITKTQLEKAIGSVGNVIVDIKHHLSVKH